MSAATWTKCEIEFVSGNLKGIKISQWIAPRLAVQGKVVDGLLGTSSYKVLSVGKSVDTYERPRTERRMTHLPWTMAPGVEALEEPS